MARGDEARAGSLDPGALTVEAGPKKRLVYLLYGDEDVEAHTMQREGLRNR